ncbi:hypothetical protein ACFYOV_10490 [Streptomyces sp. NPDC005931]|uniref:hypothetical protein n=1 Tax=Streptomyces sp. NPDC005931 TaxID=3364737 RepID=UPI0036C921F8
MVVLAVLLPLVMLGMIVILGRYEELLLRRPVDPDAEHADLPRVPAAPTPSS